MQEKWIKRFRSHPGQWVLVAPMIVLAIGCRAQKVETNRDTAVTDVSTLPEPAPVRRVAFRVPSENEITDSTVLASVRRGRALMRNTRDSLPRHVGNKLQCVSCHQGDGTIRLAMPWVGVYARFPQYRSRAASTQLIEDRINDCFKRSMNGTALVPESRDMRDIVAYMAFLSSGYPVGAEVDGQGLPRLVPQQGDSARGKTVFTNKCIACHGPNGQGTDVAPPVWGRDSYNIGAGMARVRTAAAFIKGWMPQNAPGSLTDTEAFDVARYINSQPRPDFRGKERDWPKGGAPPDVAYRTRGRAGAGKAK